MEWAKGLSGLRAGLKRIAHRGRPASSVRPKERPWELLLAHSYGGRHRGLCLKARTRPEKNQRLHAYGRVG
jgi:hypothetical protein